MIHNSSQLNGLKTLSSLYSKVHKKERNIRPNKLLYTYSRDRKCCDLLPIDLSSINPII